MAGGCQFKKNGKFSNFLNDLLRANGMNEEQINNIVKEIITKQGIN